MKKVGEVTECCLAGRNLCLDNGGGTDRKQLSGWAGREHTKTTIYFT